jgi:putative transposase
MPEWKKALDEALNNEFPCGVRGNDLKAHKRQRMSTHILQLHEGYGGFGHRADIYFLRQSKGQRRYSKVMRTIKEECIWINDFDSFKEAKKAIGKWIGFDYNKFYVHSSLG